MSFGHSVGKENKAAILFVAPLHMAIEPGNCGFLRKPFTPDAPRGAIGDCPAPAADAGPSYVTQLDGRGTCIVCGRTPTRWGGAG
jgi:hypothetical protein